MSVSLGDLTVQSCLGYAVVAFITYQLCASVLLRYNSDLGHIPGPKLASWTNLWRLYHVWKGGFHRDTIALHRKYGKLVRIGPNVVSVSDPAAIPIIYNTRGTFPKSNFYPMQCITLNKGHRPNLFSLRDEAVHRETKKKAAPAYTAEALLKMERQVDDCGTILIERLRKFAQEGAKVDIGMWVHYYAFDVVGSVTFDERIGFLETGKDIGSIIAGGEFMQFYFSVCGQVPFLHKLALGNPVLPYVFPGLEATNHGVVFAQKVLRQRIGNAADAHYPTAETQQGNDMLSRWLNIASSAPGTVSTVDVIVSLTINLFAGADTTAIGLRAALYFLIKNPGKLRKLQEELDSAFDAGKVHEHISDQEAREHLPYLNAAIKEALRLHPVVGLMLERIAPSQGAEIDGTHIPGGTVVGINGWSVQLDPDVFHDPESFQPERWLKTSTNESQLSRMERSFFAFGAGNRICMGRNLSMIEMRKILPRIFREFDFDLEGDGTWKVKGGFFTPQKMPLCSIKQRTF